MTNALVLRIGRVDSTTSVVPALNGHINVRRAAGGALEPASNVVPSGRAQDPNAALLIVKAGAVNDSIAYTVGTLEPSATPIRGVAIGGVSSHPTFVVVGGSVPIV